MKKLSAGFALRKVGAAFEHVIAQMRDMHPLCEVKPGTASIIQSVGFDAGLRLSCGPVVCHVPERASHTAARLYVVFAGTISFKSEQPDGRLETTAYGTNFAYFLVRGEVASHVLGGHYDFSPASVAHPRAHLQLGSQAQLYEQAQAQFRSLADVPLHDLMAEVLSQARPPSAQMDFLSFMLQITADHLVDDKSSEQVKSKFQALATSCDPVLGYQVGIAGGCGCPRSSHWYPTD